MATRKHSVVSSPASQFDGPGDSTTNDQASSTAHFVLHDEQDPSNGRKPSCWFNSNGSPNNTSGQLKSFKDDEPEWIKEDPAETGHYQKPFMPDLRKWQYIPKPVKKMRDSPQSSFQRQSLPRAAQSTHKAAAPHNQTETRATTSGGLAEETLEEGEIPSHKSKFMNGKKPIFFILLILTASR